ncbi:hypothetical protein V2J09_012733 [Rumex salicifolius]
MFNQGVNLRAAVSKIALLSIAVGLPQPDTRGCFDGTILSSQQGLRKYTDLSEEPTWEYRSSPHIVFHKLLG